MKRYKYIGNHPLFEGQTALGRVDRQGVFRVQVDDLEHPYSHGWHRVVGRHWQCLEPDEDAGDDLIEIRTSKGGFVGHWYQVANGAAACGYKPTSPRGFLIRGRAGWRDSKEVTVAQAQEGGFRWCPKCWEKFQKAFDLPSS